MSSSDNLIKARKAPRGRKKTVQERHEAYLVADFSKQKPFTPMKAIREKCMNCCCWQYVDIAECDIKNCSLWPYRFGRRPKKGVNNG